MLLLVFGLLRGSTWQSDAQFHTVVEVTATLLAVTVGVVALMRYYSRRESVMLYMGTAFLGTALLDGYHAVVTSTYFSQAFPSHLGSLIPWSWLSSRLFLSVFLFLGWAIWRRGQSVELRRLTNPAWVFAATGIATAASFAIFAFVPLPQAHHPGLWFQRPQELIPAAFFLMALIGHLRTGYWRGSTFAHWFVVSLIVGFMGQAMFMSFSGQIFDIFFYAAHALKIISYVFVLAGLFISIFQLFQQAETYGRALATQAAELEEARDTAIDAVEAKSQFLASVSHEIRTPMNAILGMTELALSTELSVEQREYLGTTRTSVEALITIVDDLLDLSKIEAEKLELDSIPFSLRDTVSDTVRALSVSAMDKGINLLWDMPDSIPDSVVGDPGRLRQVLVNLIGNAIKFTPEGQVNVVVELDRLGDKEVELRFDVQDTGIGIPPDKLRHIFEAFAQADASTSRRFGGTGLGLTISSQLVQLMGGTMWAESTPGVGSTLHFTAKLDLYDNARRIVSTARPGDPPPVVVLVGRDGDHHNIVEMLTQGNIQPIIITNEGAAAAVLHAERPGPAPRVLLVDDADGSFERCQRIMSDETLSDLSVIALVSVGRRGDAAEYRRLGLSGYLTKPVLQTDLLEAVGVFAIEDVPKDTFVTIHSLREQRPRLRVLLADDSPTNRQLAIRLLELRGHSVVAAQDGMQAIEAWQDGDFDVILMDVQMPGMDGIEATAAIRAREGDGVHIPIVALTAFATDSDRDRFLMAGMDAYISKPFRAEELYAAIEHLGADSPEAAAPPLANHAGSDPIDHEAALEIVGGSAELFTEIAGIFMEECPGLLDAIDDGFTAADLDVVKRASHRLKGSLGMLAALPAHKTAQRLEHSAGSGEMDQARDAWETLRAEIERLQPELIGLSTKEPLTTG
jgi:signal transduction histidine kinase/CheY-like chemotaxis protein/HPt (histidine-containing phosphotransfer) domain-containing protein